MKALPQFRVTDLTGPPLLEIKLFGFFSMAPLSQGVVVAFSSVLLIACSLQGIFF